jgi:SagB-type dehydrogenase family enzyme
VYRYVAQTHEIVRIVEGDVRTELAEASLGQSMVAQAPLSVFYSAVFERTTGRYGERGVNYVYIEVGHSAQNVYLQAESLGLGTCAIGAFTDGRVREVLRLPDDEVPVYLMPVGHYD